MIQKPCEHLGVRDSHRERAWKELEDVGGHLDRLLQCCDAPATGAGYVGFVPCRTGAHPVCRLAPEAPETLQNLRQCARGGLLLLAGKEGVREEVGCDSGLQARARFPT